MWGTGAVGRRVGAQRDPTSGGLVCFQPWCVSSSRKFFFFFVVFFQIWSCESRQRALHNQIPLDTETVFTRGENCRFCLKLLVRSGQCRLLVFTSSTRLAGTQSLFKSNPLKSNYFFCLFSQSNSIKTPTACAVALTTEFFSSSPFLFICVSGFQRWTCFSFFFFH